MNSVQRAICEDLGALSLNVKGNESHTHPGDTAWALHALYLSLKWRSTWVSTAYSNKEDFVCGCPVFTWLPWTTADLTVLVLLLL